MKTVRFSSVIEKSGQPKQHLAWSDPAKDSELKKAEKNARLLTLHQQVRGGKKDHGVVGLETGRNVQYLIFPRSLKRFAGARVVGIDYSLVGENLSFAAALAAPPHAYKNKASKPSRPAPTKPGDPSVVAFASTPEPEKPANAPRPRATPPPPPPTPEPEVTPPATPAETRREILKAVRELKAKNTSAALQRLTHLAERIEPA